MDTFRLVGLLVSVSVISGCCMFGSHQMTEERWQSQSLIVPVLGKKVAISQCRALSRKQCVAVALTRCIRADGGFNFAGGHLCFDIGVSVHENPSSPVTDVARKYCSDVSKPATRCMAEKGYKLEQVRVRRCSAIKVL